MAVDRSCIRMENILFIKSAGAFSHSSVHCYSSIYWQQLSNIVTNIWCNILQLVLVNYIKLFNIH